MSTLRKQLSIREQQIEAMECAYKVLYELVGGDVPLTLKTRETLRVAIDKLYNSLNGVAE